MKTTACSKITISALCKKAGVSRAGFYRNFKDKDDVLDEIVGNANCYSKSALQRSVAESQSKKERWTSIFNSIIHGEESFRYMLDILETGQGEILVNFLNRLADFYIGSAENSEISLISAYFWTGALDNLLTYWITHGKKETPEELADFVVSAIDN